MTLTWKSMFAAVVLSATPLIAQNAAVLANATTTVPVPVPQQTFTTGMVGLSTAQTAQLNVLNIGSPAITPAATSTPSCSVQLAFYDAKNTLQVQSSTVSLAQGMATALDLPRPAVITSTAGRLEIRGVVRIMPTITTGSAATLIQPTSCSLVTTLEIYDSSGATQFMTGDTQAVPTGTAVPVAAN